MTRMSADAQLRYKQLTGRIPGREALLKKADLAKANLNKEKILYLAFPLNLISLLYLLLVFYCMY